MAEPLETLLEVQAHDTVIDQLRHRIETLPERAELAAARRRLAQVSAALAEVQALVDDLAGRQGALEQHIAAAAKRRHEIEERMRSGAISASRDLQAMDHEVHQLGARQAQLEEDELLLLEEEEPLDLALAGHRAEAETLTLESARLQEAIVVADAEIQASIELEEVQRAERAAELPEELAERYELLRSRLGGVGAARLVGDRCDGCHLTLPSVEIERIRHLPPDQFAICTQCDRILVH
jgi:predicted  nucleic acid-binding Zn-ribbon protein